MSINSFCNELVKLNNRVGYEWDIFLKKYGNVLYENMTKEVKNECDNLINLQNERHIKYCIKHSVKYNNGIIETIKV